MTDEQIEKIVTEAVYGSDSHHWSAEAQVRKALAVPQRTPRFLLAGVWATMAAVNLPLSLTQ
jgi:hypothetical protein